jgi:formylmethanofuran dehydrogenase subunit B
MATTVGPCVCLGCGCACDDIAVAVEGDRIVAAERACRIGREWFGNGVVPARSRIGSSEVSAAAAAARAAELLRAAPALVYLAPGLATEAQRTAIAVADLAGARVDSVTSDTSASSILAGQRRGRATATLAEVRHRADLLVFWAVDPAERYPRYRERYTNPGAAVIAVDVGSSRGPPDAARRVTIPVGAEAAALGFMRAVLAGRVPADAAGPMSEAAALVEHLTTARYVVIVHDAEPSPASDPQRAEGLVALAQALNVPTRCALSSLRAGGNRPGADSALTWQTGFPFGVDFSLGAPHYRPDEPASALLAGTRSVLLAGEAAALPDPVLRALGGRVVAVVGPRASEAAFAEVAIDTGVPGIHDGGTAYRLDEVPLPLTPSLSHPQSAAAALDLVAAALLRSGAAR